MEKHCRHILEQCRLSPKPFEGLNKLIFTSFCCVFIFCVDGDFDTPSSAVTKHTYVPSLLYFHEEIMHALKVTPTIPKTEPDRRDLMMKEIEKAANWEVDQSAHVELGWMDRVYFSVSHYTDRIVRFLRLDKL